MIKNYKKDNKTQVKKNKQISKSPYVKSKQEQAKPNIPKLSPNAQKAYKLLALQEKISNNEAKDLIDRGLVSVSNRKIKIARALMNPNIHFKIEQRLKPKILFSDSNILAVDKPSFMSSSEVAEEFKEWVLLHRLDKETSGVLLFVKEGSAFEEKAKEEFKKERVYKEYVAIVQGIVEEGREINTPLLIKKGNFAKVSVSKKESGIRAITFIEPLEISGKKTKLKVNIKTGKTHQIRVHLSSINHPIIGDTLYGGKEAKRILLHAYKIKIFDYEFCASLPKEFTFAELAN
ncbi:RNA pseudouridine synthase [Helicobacter valdiviensis]|uniref:RNA pseudouridylate synthase n=1 Tax=Helicobacter valdiviensis TaxID=1458358 RepID=A0A2W6NEJ7_9HELI|nr:RluA family pseudouridine synthase [Helicobacter valdiviensis]PZT47390.1 RNA pseudouridine synthase [Helicobacter valdiviensis]